MIFRGALNVDIATMGACDGSGKTEPESAALLIAALVAPIEALENTSLLCYRNADAGIRHTEFDARRATLELYGYRAIFRSVLQSIVNQIGKHPLQVMFIPWQYESRIDSDVKLD